MSELTLGSDEARGSLETRLQKVQAIAGSLFAIFVMLHLSNIVLAPFGGEIFNIYQRLIRQFYQNPIIELLIVIGPVVTHAIVGAWLFFLRRRNPTTHKRPLVSQLHSWAGCFLLVVIAGHVLAVRGPSFFFDIFPEFEGIAYSLWYLPYWFYPYYFLLALAGFYHATNGLRTLAMQRGFRVSPGVQKGITCFAATWIVATLLSFGGVLVEVSDPADNDFARLLGEFYDTDPAKPIRF